MHVGGHDFQGDDFSPIFFSGLSNHRFTAFCNRTNQARCADTWASTRNDICWNTPHYCSICTLLVPCLNYNHRHLSNTREIGFASQNTPYIPSPKGRSLYGAFSVNGPGPRNVSTRPAALTAATSVVWSAEL